MVGEDDEIANRKEGIWNAEADDGITWNCGLVVECCPALLVNKVTIA